WWSLSSDFHNLAEAAPSAFLDALEQALEGDEPAVAALFRSDEGMMHPREYLSNLLWSLEMLARSPEYLTRAALVLSHLDAIDPGGTWGNRPSASLRRIFLGWSPQTYATPDQRLKVIDRIIKVEPVVGWKLLLRLAPRNHDTSEPSSKANWRDFSTDRPEVITWQSVAVHARAIGARLLEGVGDDVGRWSELTEHWGHFDPDWRRKAAEQLESIAPSVTDAADRERLRDKLRTLVHHHRDFSDAQWAMPESDLVAFDRVIEILRPVSAEDRFRWRFQAGTHRFSPKLKWEEQQKVIEAEQTEAAEALIADCTPDQLFSFAETVQLQHALGMAIARTQAPETVKLDLMKTGLMSEAVSAADVGVGILVALKVARGEDGDAWVEEVWRQAIAEAWGEGAEVRIVRQLPTMSSTWSAVAARSGSLSEAYWRSLPFYWLPNDADAEFVVDQLITVGRAKDAVSWLGHRIETPPDGALLVHALLAAAKSEQELHGNDATMFSHYVGLLLGRLDEDDSVDEQQIVGLEWIYFQALQHSERPARTLHRALARDPKFFVDLLTLIYLPDKESGVTEPEPEDMDHVRNMATQAHDVLHYWAHVPGADETGKIDGAALESWVKQARKLLKDLGRGEIGDSKIGQILAAVVREPEQPWPPEPVRDIIETARSRPLESGFEVGVYNRRGVTVRAPHDGGEQERVLAEGYRQDAEALRFDYPRTAACLERIATTYEVDATREDLSAEQRDWL
ncbi:MAG: hypothetical protein ACREEG_11215, partial [Phenylobacterium sp.]